MFTGIVTGIGTVRAVRAGRAGLTLTIAHPWRRLTIGESVAVDGVCLTVVAQGRGTFQVDAMQPTRARTTIGEWSAGRRVNLERALRAADRLGGHLVTGHVDGVGRVVKVAERGDALLVDVRLPREVAAVTVPLGSLAIDGVSLTVHALPRPGIAQVALIPHTRTATTLGGAAVGQRVHLEADTIAKVVRQLMRVHRASRRKKG